MILLLIGKDRGFFHLSGADNGLSGLVALGDDLLLGDEDLLGGNFDTHVT